MNRTSLALAGALLATALVGAAPTSSTALDPTKGYAGACTGADATTGTTVVVDFQELDGNGGTPAPTIVRCSPDPTPETPRTGVQALQDAGFALTGTAQYGLAFICRIENRPSATETLPNGHKESCTRTPPARAYWGYWHADGTGHTWTYSNYGAANRTVIPGGFEGWSFSLDRTATTNPPPGHDPYNPAVSSTQPTVSLTVDDLDRKITLGQQTVIRWASTNATTLQATKVAPATGGGTWSGAKTAPSGSQSLKPTKKGTYTYTIRANGSGGRTATSTVTLTVS